MISKSLDQLVNELEDTAKRISKLTDLEGFYKAQQIIQDHKEDERFYEEASYINNTYRYQKSP